MEKNKQDKIGMKEAVRLHLWAAKIWWQVEPKLFLSTIFYTIVKSGIPYLTIYFSARLLDELAGERNPAQLGKWIFITIFSTALLKLLEEILYHWKEAVHGPEWDEQIRMETEKLLDMDFAVSEAPKTREMRWKMQKHLLGNANGFFKIHQWYTEYFISGIVSAAGAVTLTVSLFTQKVPDSSGAMMILNHPLVSVLVIGILVVGMVVSPLLEAKASGAIVLLWPYSQKSNLILNFYMPFCAERERALDVRMYNQQEVVKEALQKNQLYRKGSPAVDVWRRKCAPFSALAQVVSTLLTGVAYVFVCLKAWAGAFGVGAITQYVGAITQFCGSMSHLLQLFGELSFNAQYLKDIRAFMEIPNEMYQGSLPTEKREDGDYEVEFRNVSFQYPGSKVWALRHVNMKFRVGSRLAVVGMNGSGKTTFIKLLCRLYDPTEGEILLNGIDIRKYNYEDYLKIFSVVFQDFELLALPLGQNVAARINYDTDRVKDCLKKAGFWEKTAEMEKGTDTYLYRELDKNGVMVSGGEAQKIAIARALYKETPFIILDEPTAALDPIAEAEIYSGFNEIIGDKTAVYISHRLSSCKFCDEIAVFHEGRVVQQGNHASLVADEKGKYYELWHAQAQYYEK